jgi:hypothetical protein
MSETEQFRLDQVIYYRQDDEHIEHGKFLAYGERDHPPRPGQLRIYGGPNGVQKYILMSSVLKECPCADCGMTVSLNPYSTHWHEGAPYCQACWRKFPILQVHTNFWLSCLDPESHERHQGYWYTITSGSFAHTAFHMKGALLQWLDERGLKLSEPLPPKRGVYKSMRIKGEYRVASYLNVEAFLKIKPVLKIAQMDNGHYTLGKVTEENGVRTIHHLNCNIKQRIEFPYKDICFYANNSFPDDNEIEGETPDEHFERILDREESNRLLQIKQMIEECPDIFPSVVLRLLAEQKDYHQGWENYYRRCAKRAQELLAQMNDYLKGEGVCRCTEGNRCPRCILQDAYQRLVKENPIN